ncbi:hypothetical protein [Rhizobium sp.]
MTTIRNTAAFDEALKRAKLARLRNLRVAAAIGLIVMTGLAALKLSPAL